LHFLDDDDWLAPSAFRTFYRLAQSSQAGWIYGGSQLANRQGDPLIRLDHRLQGNALIQVMSGEWIPLQASIIRSEAFFGVGGFNPRITSGEDIDLLRRIALENDLAGVEDVVAYIEMGVQGSSSDYTGGMLAARTAREALIDQPGFFHRLLYLTSMWLNLRSRRFLTALSRGLFGSAAIALSGRALFSSAYWRSIFSPYESQTFLRGFAEAGLPVQRRKEKVEV
jgi:hypothetical protein